MKNNMNISVTICNFLTPTVGRQNRKIMKIPSRAIGIVLIMCFAACNRQQEWPVQQIDLSQISENDIKLNLSEFIDTLFYIIPEAVDSGIIGTYNKVIIKNDTIVIADNFGSVFVYSISGTYINSFNYKGRGPGEYTRITDIEFYNGRIYILDNTTKMHSYNVSGEFLGGVSTPELPEYFMEAYGYLFNYTVPPWLKMNDYYRFSVYDYKLNKVNSFYRTYYARIEEGMSGSAIKSYYMFDDTLSLWEQYKDTVFRITEDFKVIPRYSLHSGKKQLSYEESLKKDARDNWMETASFSSFFETKAFLLINMRYRTNGFALFYNKLDQTGGNVVFNYAVIDHGFHNDYDGGYPFWPSRQIDEKVFITWFDPFRFKRKYEDDYFRTLKPMHEDLHKKLEENLNELDSLSNQWIMVVKFR